MRKTMPTVLESAAELLRRMQSAPDVKKRQRVHALYWVASGPARHRQDVAKPLGVHRHSVAGWFAADAAGGLEQALRYDVPRSARARRLPEPARAALKTQWQPPAGVPSSGHIRTGLAEHHQVHVSSSRVYAWVHGELRAKPKRPRPSHEKKVQRP
jgi:transposase